MLILMSIPKYLNNIKITLIINSEIKLPLYFNVSVVNPSSTICAFGFVLNTSEGKGVKIPMLFLLSF